MKSKKIRAGVYYIPGHQVITIESYQDQGTWWDIWFDGHHIGPFHTKKDALDYVYGAGVLEVKKQATRNSTGEAICHCRD
jgi:hypothetical protein